MSGWFWLSVAIPIALTLVTFLWLLRGRRFRDGWEVLAVVIALSVVLLIVLFVWALQLSGGD